MVLAAAAVERAMKRQEVIMRALSGTLTWLQAADMLGVEPRSVRRWRARFEAGGAVALYDRRQLPSPRKAPALEVQHIVRLYRERFTGWNVRHFYRFARRDHGVTLSYSFVKLALQEAGLVRKGRARGRHRRPRQLGVSHAPGGGPRRPPAADAGRARAGAARHRAHCLLLAPGTRAQRAVEPHGARPAHQRAGAGRYPDGGGGQRVSPRTLHR